MANCIVRLIRISWTCFYVKRNIRREKMCEEFRKKSKRKDNLKYIWYFWTFSFYCRGVWLLWNSSTLCPMERAMLSVRRVWNNYLLIMYEVMFLLEVNRCAWIIIIVNTPRVLPKEKHFPTYQYNILFCHILS